LSNQESKIVGRKDIFAQHSTEPDFMARFDKMMDDVEARRTPLKVAAEALHVHPRTLERAIEKRKKERASAVTYDRVDKWTDMPTAVEFEAWVTAKFNKTPSIQHSGRESVRKVQMIWADVWKKKNIALLTEADITAALTWIRNLSASKNYKRTWLMALRSLIRSGVGQHKWLAKVLDTRGSKGAARIPPELKSKETFVTVMPRLFTALLGMTARGEVSQDEFDEMELIVTCKNTVGIRTGHRKEQRELWGTVINNPKTDSATSLLVDLTGGGTDVYRARVLNWTVFAKKSETWELSRDALETYSSLGLIEKLENFITRRHLKNGDYLISMDVARARAILKRMCQVAELSHYTLHDLRKIAATRAILAGVHLETVAEMGVGWKDVATLKEYYVTIKGIHADEGYAAVKAYLNNGGREQVKN
jgi:hypothetical protein